MSDSVDDASPDDSTEITTLDDRTVSQIAAGEVVDRPASVVKELVENALDAGASRVAVAVEDGGLEGIRVRDDGTGIPSSQLPRAVAEHATSKLDGIRDLEEGMTTLGFRGEALHAIGAVSRMKLRSRPPNHSAGGELVVDHGDVGEVRGAGCPVGTTVEVRELFAETPARRKFLKTAATEFDRINRVVAAYALANPDVSLSLEHDGREVFATPGDGDLRTAVLAVYGREVAEAMIRVGDPDTGGMSSRETIVSGLVSHPETTRSTRQYITTFVNGRTVRSPEIRSAILDAYGGQLASDRFPFAVLFVDVPPDTVDVNVHPRKTEIRFNDHERVIASITETVREALLEHGFLRSSAARGKSAPSDTSLEPEVIGGAGTSHERAAGPEETPGTTSEETRADSDSPSDETTTAVLDAWDDIEAESTEDAAATDVGVTRQDDDPRTAPSENDTVTERDEETRSRPSPRNWQSDVHTRVPQSRSRTTPSQATLGGGTTADRVDYEKLPSMRILGQFDETYFVAEAPAGLLLIDQHAADERINYERLRDRIDEQTPVQELAAPASLELTVREAELFDSFDDALSSLGFRAERLDDQTVQVTAVPAVFDATLDPDLLRDVLAAFTDGVAAGERTLESAADELLADLACYPSITGNTSLTEGTAAELLDTLDDCENPYACPHGRPVIVELSRDEVEERFERDYPGHDSGHPRGS